MNTAQLRRQELRKKVWDKSNGRCWYCGVELVEQYITPEGEYKNFHVGNSFIVEHMNNNIGDNIENLFPSCQSCNTSKRKKTLEQWRKDKGIDKFWFEEKGL